jgi:hypothetical protein
MAQLQRYNYARSSRLVRDPVTDTWSTDYSTGEDPLAEGGKATISCYEANAGNVSGVIDGEPIEICDACGFAFPKSKTMLFRGVTYGIPCGCSTDARSVLSKEAADRYRPPRTKPEREGKMLEGWF